MKKQHGGKRKGAGMKPGLKKTKLKPSEERHSLKRQVSYTKAQGERVDAAMKVLDTKKHTDFARYAVLMFCDEILQDEGVGA